MVIGYTTGVYDMFHVGHLNILRQAKELCDYLIVGVSTDELVQKEKNKTPIIPFEERCAIVQSIRYVDEVVPQLDKDKLGAWSKYHFNKMFVGSAWQGTPTWQIFEEKFALFGVEVVYLAHTDGISSIILREKLLQLNGIQINLKNIVGGGKIGYTTGVYDMFHIGHLNLLRRAKELCEYLIVGVSTNEVVESYKHKKPIFTYEERAAIIASCKYVDCIVPQNSMDKFEAWQSLHFNIMFHGDEWKGTELYEKYERQFASVGSEIIYLPHTDGISSTILRNKLTR